MIPFMTRHKLDPFSGRPKMTTWYTNMLKYPPYAKVEAEINDYARKVFAPRPKAKV